jgi:hypothetical protein
VGEDFEDLEIEKIGYLGYKALESCDIQPKAQEYTRTHEHFGLNNFLVKSCVMSTRFRGLGRHHGVRVVKAATASHPSGRGSEICAEGETVIFRAPD